MTTNENTATVRVCAIADIECSRGCGTGECKREREARYPDLQPAAAPKTLNEALDAVMGACKTDPKLIEALEAAAQKAAPSPADERAALSDQDIYDKFSFLEGLVNESTYVQIADTAIEIARAASASETAADVSGAYTYSSVQATNCARCGNYKHTPLRIDWMGGYVCLTCIDRELESRSPAMAAEAVTIPAGWKLVPVDPTPEILMAIWQNERDARRAWERALAAAPQPAQADARQTDDEWWNQALRERDIYEEYADEMASAIANHLHIEIGEHSNFNNPWLKALEAIKNARQAAARVGLTGDEWKAIRTLKAYVEDRAGLIARESDLDLALDCVGRLLQGANHA